MTLEEFINGPEFDEYMQKRILETIEQGRASNKFKDELFFNIHNIEIYYEENKIVIVDDISPEDKSLVLSIDEFVKVLSELKSK